MSERLATTDSGGSRPRRPWRRFRDLPIWSKLGMIMIVPTLATIVVGTNGLIGHIDTANSADRARVLADLTGTSGELVHALQDERAAAVLLLGTGDAQAAAEDAEAEEADGPAAAYSATQQAVDQPERQFQSRSSSLTDVPASYRELLSEIRNQLSLLPQTRNEVAAGELGLTDAIASYEELIVDLINLRDASAQLAGDSELSDRMRAAAGISRAKEFLSQQRVVGHEVLIRDAYPPHLRAAFIGTQTGQEQALQGFTSVATAAEQAALDQALEGSDVRQSQLYQDYLDSLEGEELVDPPWNAEAWDGVMSAHANLLRDLEQGMDGVVVSDATDLRDAVTRQVLVEAGALLAMLLLAILLAWLVARSMARSLRDLRQGALSVAQYGLPQAVARLRDPSLSTQLSPTQVASQIAEPLPVQSKDEFGQVAEAFNAVHLEAVRTAAEQAQLRSSVATMFVNLARRSQILVDRLINQLDRLERGEQDPDRLGDLFQLDHLATRMRRNDENLLVLAGADSTRVQREPASLIDVLRAAQSEVEHYTRIEFGVVDRDLEAAAHAVNDLVHLVAELLDNATVFSPPDSQVMVEARRVGDRAVLYVEDRGLGLSAEQLAEINERLATPPMVDVAVSRMMGLVVVSRLAARHGVKVELRPASPRGTIADVTLPASVLVPRSLDGRAGVPGQPAGIGPPYRPELPGERPALESGPVADGRRPAPPFEPPDFARPPSAPANQPGSAPPASVPPVSAPPMGAQQPSPFTQGFSPPSPSAPFSPGSGPDQYGSPPESPPGGRSPGQRPGGRSMPAWSDLTGATAAGGTGAAPAPAPAPGAGAGPPALGAGAPGHNGADLAGGMPGTGAAAPGTPTPPLPRRRPGAGIAGEAGEPPAGPSRVPRPGDPAEPDQPPPPGDQPPPFADFAGPTAPPAEQPPTSSPTFMPPLAAPQPPPPSPAMAPPPSVAPPAGPPAGVQPAAPPPWPPVAPETATPVPADAAAASDPAPAAGQAASGQRPPADETMELPIFRELESVWFRTPKPRRQPAPPPAGATAGSGTGATDAGAAPTTELATVGASGPTAASAVAGNRMGSDAAPEGAGTTSASDGWRTAADDGWRAASTAAEVAVQETTAAGLPKRRPMAQLVPGGVEKSPATTERRSPEAVRGLLSAYHRGVQRGREQITDDEPSGSAGS